MRVVHLGKYYPPASGGIETHTQTLVRGLAARGVEVQVVVVNHADRAGRDATFERWTRTPGRVDDDGPVRVHRAGRLANLAKLDVAPGLFALLREQLRRPPDLWHLHAPNITMMLAILALPKIRPLLITHHSDIVRQRVLKHLVRPFERALYRRAKGLLSDSPPYIGGSAILQRFRAKVEDLPLGLPLDPFLDPSPAALAHADRLRREHPGPLWVTVGRLIYYKGLDTALRALRHVPGRLIVVGTGPMEPAWRALATELGVGDRVTWRGRTPQDELIGTYHAATAHWFPSNARSEGYGLVQVEAMASGCPTVNTAIEHSGVSWVCRHGEAGLTVPVNDPAAFAAASNRLLAEPGLRERLAAFGKRDAVARLSADAMAERCLAIYRRAVAA